ncbi:Rha family transcriptional regulator [Marinobacterium sp. AK62]|uniref:Rha family transcriptional regulator n=1 Tax=Marinobacterium alkalitolerans TaxID=1542925 RepID=A0ABS3Z7K0_9GAMM|nr:Rha family transcriptional regulator [Marinobacterium alkalitolerans]MBP0047672.1 Rha family transcriptional regulator [Marinobacterium alkalitolerans]
MNDVIRVSNTEQVTMTSAEIADLVEARHDSVKRTIERLAERGAIQLPPLVEVQNHLGQRVSVYSVGKRDSYVIVAQLSPEFTARLVDRWQALEQQVSSPYQLPDFNNPAVAARAWADAVEQGQQLALENQQVRRDLEHMQSHFVDGMKIVDFAKTLNGVNCQEIQKHLSAIGWLRRDGFSGWRVNSKARDKYLAERTTIWIHPTTEEERERHYPVLLRAGAVRLFQMYTQEQLPMKKTWNGKIGHAAEVMQ